MEEQKDKLYIWTGCRRVKPSLLDFGVTSIRKIAISSSQAIFLSNCGRLLLFEVEKDDLKNLSSLTEYFKNDLFIDIACSENHTAVVRQDGVVICWGDNSYLQCGNSESLSKTDPCFIKIETDSKQIIRIAQVACGKMHTLCLSDTGVMWVWGSGVQLGLQNVRSCYKPQKINSLAHKKVIKIICGLFHSIAIVSNESKDYSQINNDTSSQDSVPIGEKNEINSQYNNSNLKYSSKSGIHRSSKSLYSLNDASPNHHHPLPIPSSLSFNQKFDSDCSTRSEFENEKLCPPQSSTASALVPKCFLSKSPISELIIENEEETSFMVDDEENNNVRDGMRHIDDQDDLKFSKLLFKNDENLNDEMIRDAAKDVEMNIFNLDDDHSDVDETKTDCNILIKKEPYQSFTTNEPPNLDPLTTDQSISETTTSNIPQKSTTTTTTTTTSSSSFLDEFKAKEFLQKQLEYMNPLVQETIPSYGSVIQSKLESASTAVRLLASSDPLSKRFEHLLQHVPSSTGVVQEYVSQLTKTVVSNIRTTVVDKLASTTEHFEALTEGVSGGVREVVKMAKKKSFGSDLTDENRDGSSKARDLNSDKQDLINLCAQNNPLIRSDSVTKSTSMNPMSSNDMEDGNSMPTTTASEMTMESKQTHHRNVSLPTGTLENITGMILRTDHHLMCWDTEVWSWGQGSRGQLGQGDVADRDEPSLMSFFCHEHISMISAGAYHNVALSHSGQVYVWGCNKDHQLAHPGINFSACPLLLELQGGLPSWSVTAGEKHTLIACDDLNNSPHLFYAGHDYSCKEDRLNVVQQLVSFNCLKNMGHLQEIFSGGAHNISLIRPRDNDDVNNDNVVMATVYELSCSERFFCLMLKKVLSKFFQPLIQKLDVKECSGLVLEPTTTTITTTTTTTTTITILTSPTTATPPTTTTTTTAITTPDNLTTNNTHWSYTFRLLFSKLSYLQQLVARNQGDLRRFTRSLSLATTNPLSLTMVSEVDRFVNSYASCFRALCDAVSCLCFEACVKNNKEFFEMISDDFHKYLEADKVADHATSMLHLSRLPYYRLRDYQKTLDKLASFYPAYTNIHAELQRCSQAWRKLKQASDSDHNESLMTASYWRTAHHKLIEVLPLKPTRRLIRDGKVHPISMVGGGTRLFSWSSFVLFSDCFLHVQYSGYTVYQLPVLWVEVVPDTKSVKNAITLITPEENLTLTTPTHSEKAEWVWSIQQAIRQSLSRTNRSNASKSAFRTACLNAPMERHASYTFLKSGWLKDAHYVGQWRNGHMHGKGELNWPNLNKKYSGVFSNGLMSGYGTMTQQKDAGGAEVVEGMWARGQLNGFGIIKYSNGDVYRGHFIDGKRHGHGTMKQGKFITTSASIYYGQWCNDKKSGYGVFDDIPKGQKYMGSWSDDNKHGRGVVVTLDGYYFEGNFNNGKMIGRGLLMTEDNHIYEGDFSGFSFAGKGTLTLPSGDMLEGSFGGNFVEGVKVTGVLRKVIDNKDGCSGNKDGGSDNNNVTVFGHQTLPKSFGKMSYPANEKWSELINQCYLMLGCSRDNLNNNAKKSTSSSTAAVAVDNSSISSGDCGGGGGGDDDNDDGDGGSGVVAQDCFKVWEKVATFVASNSDVGSQNSLQHHQHHHHHHQHHQQQQEQQQHNSNMSIVPSFCNDQLSFDVWSKIESYLQKAFELPYHPLGVLLGCLVDVYLATYVGISAHVRLLYHAVMELKAYVDNIYAVVRLLFPRLPPANSFVVLTNENSPEYTSGVKHIIASSSTLILPIIMPKIYPPLINLFNLHNERDDERYSKRISVWNKQSNYALMVCLGVDRKFIPFKESEETMQHENCYNYNEAIDQLQRLSTSFSPLEKLFQIQKSFHEINLAVERSTGAMVQWCMDDLFPLFLFIVIRSRIQHLGAEINFINELMDKNLEIGELGIMFTTLKACYFQILSEKMF